MVSEDRSWVTEDGTTVELYLSQTPTSEVFETEGAEESILDIADEIRLYSDGDEAVVSRDEGVCEGTFLTSFDERLFDFDDVNSADECTL